MKQGLFFAALLAILGIAGFLYRNTLEGPTYNTNADGNVACQADARVCADGTSISRTGPSCEFAACPFPNIELPQANISFVLPAGFDLDEMPINTDPSLIGSYIRTSVTSSSTVADSMSILRYQIPEGNDANTVMLENTVYETSGIQPESMAAFTPVIINGRTYQMIVIDRFEGIVKIAYYLPRERDVIRFEATEHGVLEWIDPNLNVRTLPTIAALENLLATVQVN